MKGPGEDLAGIDARGMLRYVEDKLKGGPSQSEVTNLYWRVRKFNERPVRKRRSKHHEKLF